MSTILRMIIYYGIETTHSGENYSTLVRSCGQSARSMVRVVAVPGMYMPKSSLAMILTQWHVCNGCESAAIPFGGKEAHKRSNSGREGGV